MATTIKKPGTSAKNLNAKDSCKFLQSFISDLAKGNDEPEASIKKKAALKPKKTKTLNIEQMYN